MKVNFCEKVAELQARKNISLQDLARRSGLPLKMLEELEKGVIPKEMTVDNAIDLAGTFGCEIQELFR
ncbi:XRE family transcriptional regulator [Colidextribacter sp. OB.20]|nr:XRE family transcriptional regulator [Colidextribacter sp. OB.20]